MNNVHLTLLFALKFFLVTSAPIAAQNITENSISAGSGSVCVILSASDDPYLSLAQTIASNEGFRIVHDLSAALSLNPEFMIWVASPDHLDEAALMRLGKALGTHGTAVALGIITGSTIQQAQALWERGAIVAANSVADLSYDEGITLLTGTESRHHEFSVPNIRDALQDTDYIHYRGHGFAKGWASFPSEHVPDDLGPVLVTTASCETVRPYVPDNIALRFIDNGAAGYIGFTWSPAGAYFMGSHRGFPFRYAWPGCTVGHILQIINQGTLKTFARFPQCFLLGDPRLVLQNVSPYQVVRDQIDGNSRTIEYRDCPPGIVPVRIPDGAEYSFVKVAEGTSVSRSDIFFNSHLQHVDIGDNKYVLVQSPGGEVTLTLRKRTPILWFIGDTFIDLLDRVVPVRDDQSGLKLIGLAVILPCIAWLGWRRQIRMHYILYALSTGVLIGTTAWLYALTRNGSDTVTFERITTGISPYAVDMLLIAGTSLLFMAAKTRWTKGFALFWASFPTIIIPALLPILMVLQFIKHATPYSHQHIPLALLAGSIGRAILLWILIHMFVSRTPRVSATQLSDNTL